MVSPKRIWPVAVVLGLAYLDYAACYVVGYREVYLHKLHGAAVALWVLVGFAQLSLLMYWALIVLRGPGATPKLLPLDLFAVRDAAHLPLPAAFICDEQGYPYWCSKCRIIKPKRAFHLSDLDRCVPRFDHYCLWIGTAVGRANFVVFVKFLEFFAMYFVVVFAYTIATTRGAVARGRTPHYVVLYVFCVFWLLMILTLFVQQCYYMTANLTTLDDMTVKQARTYGRWSERAQKAETKMAKFCIGKSPRVEPGHRYLNIDHNGTRVVVRFHVRDRPYSLGFRRNVVNIALNGNYSRNSAQESRFWWAMAVLFVPYMDLLQPAPQRDPDVTYDSCSDDFDPAFLQLIRSRADAGCYSHALYLPVPAKDTDSQPQSHT